MFTKTSFLLYIYIYIYSSSLQLVYCKKVRFHVYVQWHLQSNGMATKIAPSIHPFVQKFPYRHKKSRGMGFQQI